MSGSIGFYKNSNGRYLDYLSKGYGQEEISEAEYNEILSIIRTAPTPPDGYVYSLRADTLEWELVEAPPDPIDPNEDLDDSAAFGIIFGGTE